MHSTRRYVASWVAVVALFALAWWLFGRGMLALQHVNAPDVLGVAAVGRTLPDTPLVRLDGSATTLRSFVGHPLWINFFATWCAPCKAELPEVVRRYNARKAQRLVVLGIDQQESPKVVRAFAQRFAIRYPIAIDEGLAAAHFRIQTIPVSVFADAGGTVRWIQIGQMPADAMDSALAKILP